MCSTPVLALPDFTKSFEIEIDSCYGGIGVVLMQDKRPITFLNQSLGPQNLGMSIYEKELLALVTAVTNGDPTWKRTTSSLRLLTRV